MSTIARLSFWVAADRIAEFVAVYDREVVPLLEQHGLVHAASGKRTTIAGICSWLFEVETPIAVGVIEQALQQDPVWQQKMRLLGDTFGRSESGQSIRYDWGIYSTPAGLGKTVAAGPGSQSGAWHVYSVQDGLRSPVIGPLLQDRNGNLWIGTWDGVFYYDGAHFTHFTRADGLADDPVYSLAEDREGHIWFGTGHWAGMGGRGVTRYDGKTFETFTAADGLGGSWVGAIHLDRAGHLWFATEGAVSRYDGQRFEIYDLGLEARRVYGIAEERSGALWFCTMQGMSRYDGQVFTAFTTDDGLTTDRVHVVFVDRDDQVWAGTEEGLHRLDGALFIAVTPKGGAANRATALREDRAGHLWLTVYPHGLCRYDGQDFTSYTTQDGLPSHQVVSILEDRQGYLWFGTQGGGLCRYDPERCVSFPLPARPVDNTLFTLLEDRQGHLWLGGTRGVLRFDGQAFTHFTRDEGVFRTTALALFEDREGVLWQVTYSGAVWRFEGEAWTLFIESRGRVGHDLARSIAQDREGRLWFATGGEGGVLCYDGEGTVTYTVEDGLVDNNVRALCVDRQGSVWLAMVQGGVSVYDGRQFATVTEGEGLGHCSGRAIWEDRQGHLWFATDGAGVSRFDGRQFTRFTTEDGLAYDRVLCIGEDGRGHLWFGTQGGGVSRFDGSVFQTLSREEGLPNDLIGGLLQDRQGDMWLAGEDGLTRYRASAVAPAIQIREVVADRPYGPASAISLSVSHEFVRFEFQGKSFTTRPDGMVYLYRLEGRDRDWQVTRQRRITYTHLERGSYVFQVKAVDRDLNYSEVATVAVEVLPDPRLAALSEALSQGEGTGEFIGQSPALAKVQLQLAEVAPSDLTVMILGETGTGKGLAAHTVHALSNRKEGPFIHVNCGAFAEGLVESELFGHERGAFTSAHARKLGKVELAKEGTLFLDEIGDMPLKAQVKLLRLLEERTYERVGGTETLFADVRVIAATNRDLMGMVEQDTFREDLFFRLQVFPVQLPPLRERREDIPVLVDYFMASRATHLHRPVPAVMSEALSLLKNYDWPGNVRELQHVIERAVVVCKGTAIRAEDVPLISKREEVSLGDEIVSLEEYEKRYIEAMLDKTGWVIKGPKGAALLLKLHPATLRNRMKKLGIVRP